MKHPDSIDSVRLDAMAMKKLMQASTVAATPWCDEELGPMLKHQLAAPLAEDVSEIQADAKETLSMAATGGKSAPSTFGELLNHPSPSVEVLRLVKDYAKTLRTQDHSGFPAPIATALYYASILAARIRTQTRISDLDDVALQKGCAWALRQSWMTDDLRALFEEGRLAVEAGNQQSSED